MSLFSTLCHPMPEKIASSQRVKNTNLYKYSLWANYTYSTSTAIVMSCLKYICIHPSSHWLPPFSKYVVAGDKDRSTWSTCTSHDINRKGSLISSTSIQKLWWYKQEGKLDQISTINDKEFSGPSWNWCLGSKYPSNFKTIISLKPFVFPLILLHKLDLSRMPCSNHHCSMGRRPTRPIG